MCLPVPAILSRQRGVVEHEKVFGVTAFRLLSEIVAACNDSLAVDDDNLIVRDGVLSIHSDGDACAINSRSHERSSPSLLRSSTTATLTPLLDARIKHLRSAPT
jgi:hypothetical protein